MRGWARQVRARNDSVIVRSLPARERWAMYLAVALTQPKALATHFLVRFRMWTIMPGDRMRNVLRQVEGEVVSVKGDRVVLRVASLQMLDRGMAPDWPYGLPPNVTPAYEVCDPSDGRWVPA